MPALLSAFQSQYVPPGLFLADKLEGLAIPDVPTTKVSPPARVLTALPLVLEEHHLQMPAVTPRYHPHPHLNLWPCFLKQWQFHRQEELQGNEVHLVGPIECYPRQCVHMSIFQVVNNAESLNICTCFLGSVTRWENTDIIK